MRSFFFFCNVKAGASEQRPPEAPKPGNESPEGDEEAAEESEDEAAPPEEAPAPPNSPPAGFAASPSFFPNEKPPPLPNVDGVDDAPV